MKKDVAKSSDDWLSSFIKQALDAGFKGLAYWLLTLGAVIPMLLITSGHNDDEILSYFRYCLLILSISAVVGIIFGYPRTNFANAPGSANDAISKNEPPLS
jgi:hypothetical protein